MRVLASDDPPPGQPWPAGATYGWVDASAVVDAGGGGGGGAAALPNAYAKGGNYQAITNVPVTVLTALAPAAGLYLITATAIVGEANEACAVDVFLNPTPDQSLPGLAVASVALTPDSNTDPASTASCSLSCIARLAAGTTVYLQGVSWTPTATCYFVQYSRAYGITPSATLSLVCIAP